MRGANKDNSFHLATSDNAVKTFSVYVLSEFGIHTISVEIEGMAGRLILDTGSNVSIMQPGISTCDVRVPLVKPYCVTGETLKIKGQQFVSFALERRE